MEERIKLKWDDGKEEIVDPNNIDLFEMTQHDPRLLLELEIIS